MVIPWYGFPLADLINKLEPQPGAQYVRMETLRAGGH
jgi:sulfoxide reductase catalytic subunit YedY